MKKIAPVLLFTLFLFSVRTVGQPCIWNLNNLDQAKGLSSESSGLLVRIADKELKKTILTVMDKEMIPPSGNKHDYISMGKYWWPNPKTADGLPYIRKDGISNPETEKYDRGSLGMMAKSVTNLSLAYHLTSNEKYAKKAVANLRIWFMEKETCMNPNMNFGQTIPGHSNGKGRGEGLIDTYSFVEMLDGVELLRRSPVFTKSDNASLKAWFTSFLDWMLTSEVGKEEFEAGNNHGTAFDVQVARYALFVGKEDLAKQFIREFPARRLFKQIEPDGSQPLELARTKAFSYSVFNLTHFLDMCMLAKHLNIDLFDAQSSDGRSISKAIDFLLPYSGKTSDAFPYKQITDWESSWKSFYWVLYRVNKFVPNEIYQNLYAKYLNLSGNDINNLYY